MRGLLRAARRPEALLAAALAVAVSSPAPVPLPVWETSGPPLFQVNAVAAGPDDRTVYAGSGDTQVSQSAIYRSLDGGRTWQALVEAARGEFYSEILIDPRDPRRIYAGALGNGGATNIYRSTDGGATWSLSDTISLYRVPSLAAGARADTVLVSCGTRLRRSDDAGQTWRDTAAPFTENVRLTPAPGGTLIAYGATSIFKTTSDGDSWTPAGQAPPACPGIQALRADPVRASVLVAGTGLTGTGGFQCGGVYRSIDAGNTWSAGELSGVYVTDIAIDNDDPSVVYASAGYLSGILPRGGVYVSRDGGATWSNSRLPALGALRLALPPSGRLLHAATSLGVFEHEVRKPRLAATRP